MDIHDEILSELDLETIYRLYPIPDLETIYRLYPIPDLETIHEMFPLYDLEGNRLPNPYRP